MVKIGYLARFNNPFKYIFREILLDFQGDIIIELANEDKDIINAKEIIQICLA